MIWLRVVVAASAVLFVAWPAVAKKAERQPVPAELGFDTLSGERLSFAELRGRTVLIDFWATWCAPCRESVSSLKTIRRRLADKPFELISVSLDRDRSQLDGYIEDERLAWPQVWDPRGEIARAFGVQGVPRFVVLDHEGIVRAVFEGWSPDHPLALSREIGRCLKRQKKAAKAAGETSG